MITLENLLDLAEKQARVMLLEMNFKQLVPCYVLMAADGEYRVIACPWEGGFDKQIMLAKVRAEAQAMKAVALSHLSEAWISAKRYASIEEERRDLPPSQQPGRREAIIILATDGIKTVARQLKIERDWKSKITGLPRDKTSSEDQFTGRIIDGLLPVGGRA